MLCWRGRAPHWCHCTDQGVDQGVTGATRRPEGEASRCQQPRSAVMSVMAEATAVRPFQIEVPEEQLDDLRRRIAATRWPSEELVADRSQGVQLATLQALARYWTTEYDWRTVRGEAERAAAVHDRDRRGRDPLHPRPVAARERAAADHDPRLARLGHRAARHRRPADRPDRARRHRRGRVPPGAAVPARLRLLRRADRARLGERPHRAARGRS